MKNTSQEKTILVVSLVNAGVNAILAIFKIVIGIIGFSQALIADGIHSFSDLISDALVFIAARASMKHPDEDHPYGHQRIETLGTIIIALILASVAGSIAYEAVMRLLHQAFEHKPSTEVVIVAVVSIIANEALFHYSRARGNAIASKLLVSNAWHKRSDVFVSVIVLLSVIGSQLGWHFLDAIGAFIISILIFKLAATMIWHAAQELIDHSADEKTLEKIKQVINGISGVSSIHQLRTRLHGNSVMIDLHIIVDPAISVSEGHHIGEAVHAALLKQIDQVNDVTVHIDPENDEIAHPSLHLPNREKIKALLATHWKNLPGYAAIQKITLHYLAGKLTVEIVIPNTACATTPLDTLQKQYQAAIADIKEITHVVIYLGTP